MRRGDMIPVRHFDPMRASVGIFSPASTAIVEFPVRFQRAMTALAAMGWTVRMATNAAEETTPSAACRAADIHELLVDESVGLLMAATGGYGSNEILDHLDGDIFRAHAKPVLGFSDVTALLLGITALTGLVTFHGPALLPSFGDVPEPAAYSVANMMAVVGKQADYPLRLSAPESYSDEFLRWDGDDDRALRQRPHEGWHVLAAGTAEGPLVGGNLDTLLSQIGTPYVPDLTGALLFVETAFSPLPKVVRDLTALAQAGVFGKIAGLILGRPFHLSEGTQQEFLHFGTSIARHWKLPAIASVDIGHTSPMLTMPMEVRARMDTADGVARISLLEGAVI